jgi:hypothetical protein
VEPKDIIARVTSVTAAAAALLVVIPSAACSKVADQTPTVAVVPRRNGQGVGEAAKLLLAPAAAPVGQTVGHSSHSSHASHYSHQSGATSPDTGTPSYVSPGPTPAPDTSAVQPPAQSIAPSSAPTVAPSAPTPPPAVSLPVVEPKPVSVTPIVIDQLTASDLAGKSDWDLVLLRNAYYARHGYAFAGQRAQTVKVRKYFELQPWFNPDTTDSSIAQSRMTGVERRNIDVIVRLERQRASAGKRHL